MTTDQATRLHIRLLGAPGTGRTRLAAELMAALSAGPSPFLQLQITVDAAPASRHAGPTLLMGLDLPVPHASADAQQAADHALRDALAQAGIAYQVIYGHGAQRLHSALGALRTWLAGAGLDAQPPAVRERWVWSCDKCSDPQCERRLLSDLLAARSGLITGPWAPAATVPPGW